MTTPVTPILIQNLQEASWVALAFLRTISSRSVGSLFRLFIYNRIQQNCPIFAYLSTGLVICYTLPTDLSTDAVQPIQLVDYTVPTPCIRNKINLTSHVISFLSEGTKQLIAQNQSITIDSNQFLIIKAGNCLMSEKLAQNNWYSSLLLFFTNEAVIDFIRHNDLHPTPGPPSAPFLMGEHDAYTANFIQGLHLVKTLDPAVRHRILASKFEEIMLYLLHQMGESFLHMLASGTEPFNPDLHFKRIVEANALNPLSVQEMAFLCHMSSSTFKRYFKKHYTISPIRWFQQRRLAHSAHLLTTTQKRPSDLYEEVGFESLSSYTQAFKQTFGLTPKQYQLRQMSLQQQFASV